jgi:hypothetical protein
MFAVEGVMLPSGIMYIVPDCAFAGWIFKVNANTNKPKNNNATIRLETSLLNVLSLLSMIRVDLQLRLVEQTSS